MSLRSWFRGRFGTSPGPRELGEADAPADTGMSRTRGTGGGPPGNAPDTHSTTGTTPNETFVGRASGDEAGAGETGAEVRGRHGQHRSDEGEAAPTDEDQAP